MPTMLKTMGKTPKPKVVGNYIRERREAAKLSQRALGLLFNPPVTTQFISNLERGVTPLPLHHVPTLTQALKINEGEMLVLLEKEYVMKLSGRMARMECGEVDTSSNSSSIFSNAHQTGAIKVVREDLDFMTDLYSAYQSAEPKTRQTFHELCRAILSLRK